MFTGLIEQVGRLAALERRGSGGMRIAVEHEPWEEPLRPGDSISVNGSCLTVTEAAPALFRCDLLAESLDRTALGGKSTGAPLNLERALRAGDRLGGHFVTGHVDGTGAVAERRRAGRDWVLAVTCETGLLAEMAVKGSVACEGVSLTLAAVTERGFEVHVIPFTWERTNLGRLAAGDAVNIETDVLAKYVRRAPGAAQTGLSMETLRQSGFA